MKDKLGRILWLFFFSFLLALAASPVQAVPATDVEEDLMAQSAFAFDYETGQVLVEKDAATIRPIASLTKMITAYIILQAIETGEMTWDESVTASQRAAEISQIEGLSNVPLIEAKDYTARELMEALAIYSANSAAIALAEHYAGSEEAFVQLMKQQLEEWGIDDYQIYNASGLNNALIPEAYWYPQSTVEDENQMATRDIAQVAYRLVSDHPVYLDFASIPQKVFRPDDSEETLMVNYNKMLPGLEFERAGVNGIKTGTTHAAGACLAFSAQQEGRSVLGVVMNAGDGIENTAQRFQATNQVLDYAFDQFRTIELSLDDILKDERVPIQQGQKKKLTLTSPDHYPLTLGQSQSVQEDDYRIHWKGDKVDRQGRLLAPVKQGESLGYLELEHPLHPLPSLYDEPDGLYRYELLAAESVAEISPLEKIWRGLKQFSQAIRDRLKSYSPSWA